MAVALGMPFLVLFMAVVMGWLYAYFLGLDKQYIASEGLSEAERIKIWYNR